MRTPRTRGYGIAQFLGFVCLAGLAVFVAILAGCGSSATVRDSGPKYSHHTTFEALPWPGEFVGQYRANRCNNGACWSEWGEYTGFEVANPIVNKRVGEGYLSSSDAHLTLLAAPGWEWKWYGNGSGRDAGYYLQKVK